MSLLHQSDRLDRRHLAILVLAFVVWWQGFYSLTVLSFLLGGIQRDFQLLDGDLALLTGLGIGATGLGGFLFGWLADKTGRRASTATALGVFCLGNAFCALAPSFSTLLVARGVAGLGIGGAWGAGQALIGETFPPAERGRWGAVAQSGAPLGLGLAALVGAFVAPGLGWRGVFALSTLPILALPLVRRVPESDLWRQAGPGGQWRQLLARGTRGTFALAFLLTAFNMTAYWLAVIWLPRYLQVARGLSEARSGVATLAFVLGSLLGYLSFGRISDRWGRRPTFAFYSGLLAGGLVMFTLFWPWVAAQPGLVYVFLFTAGLGTGTWSGFGPMLSELFATPVRGTALSVIMNTTRGAQFLAPLAIAAVAPRWGLGGGIALAAGFALLAGSWIWALPETRGKVLEAAPTPP